MVHITSVSLVLLLGVVGIHCQASSSDYSPSSGPTSVPVAGPSVPSSPASSSSVAASPSSSSSSSASSLPSDGSASSPSSSLAATGAEGRQINGGQQLIHQSSSSGSPSSSFPYSLYPNNLMSVANNVLPQTPSSAGSWLSILRPSHGGRRASLTSRLRNIYNAIFRREQNTPGYMSQGSSLTYSLRQPPMGFSSFNGFGSNSLPTGFSSNSLPAGFTSGLTPQYQSGSMGSNYASGPALSSNNVNTYIPSNQIVSSQGSSPSQGSYNNQNLYASASGYNPIVVPSNQLSSGSLSNGPMSSTGHLSAAASNTVTQYSAASGGSQFAPSTLSARKGDKDRYSLNSKGNWVPSGNLQLGQKDA